MMLIVNSKELSMPWYTTIWYISSHTLGLGADLFALLGGRCSDTYIWVSFCRAVILAVKTDRSDRTTRIFGTDKSERTDRTERFDFQT